MTAVYCSMTKYDQLLMDQATHHRVLQKLHLVYRSADFLLSPNRQSLLESIDKVKSKVMIYAEKYCHSLCMGKINFSPDVNIARGHRLVWQLVLKQQSGQNVRLDKIQHITKAVGIKGDLLHPSMTLGVAHRSFKAADEAYHLLKQNAPMMREDFLCKQARA